MQGASGISAIGAEILELDIGQIAKREQGDAMFAVGDRGGHPIIDHPPEEAGQFARPGMESLLADLGLPGCNARIRAKTATATTIVIAVIR